MSILSKFVNLKNKQYGQINPVDFAKKFFKDSLDEKTAIVQVLSNTGIAGYKFNIPQTELIKLESDITDHYSDANVAFQDHIARRPITITLTGLEGEYFYSVNRIEDTLGKVIPTLKLVKQFLPKISAQTMKIKTEYAFSRGADGMEFAATAFGTDELMQNPRSILSTVNDIAMLNGVDLFKLFQELYKLKSPQTRAYFFFEAMWRSNKPFTVETTWKRFDNMLITSMQAVRDNNADITEFTVTFKQINITESRVESVEQAVGRTRQQLSKVVKKGVDKGQEVKTI